MPNINYRMPSTGPKPTNILEWIAYLQSVIEILKGIDYELENTYNIKQISESFIYDQDKQRLKSKIAETINDLYLRKNSNNELEFSSDNTNWNNTNHDNIIPENIIQEDSIETVFTPDIKNKQIATVNFKGRSIINELPTSIANCQDINSWIVINSTKNIDTSNKLFNNNSLQIISTIVGPFACYAKAYINNTKYYCISEYTKNIDTATSIGFYIRKDSTNSNIKSVQCEIDTIFNRKFIKLSPTELTDETQIQLYYQGISTVIGQKFNIAALMLNEISETEYNDPLYSTRMGSK